MSDVFVLTPGCYVLGVHGGLKELVPIIHRSSYFVSYPRVALATDFCLFKRYVFITYFIEHQVPRPLHIVFVFEYRSETWNDAHERSAWNYLALKCLK